MWQVNKRSNSLQVFSKEKILNSIIRAQENINAVDKNLAGEICNKVYTDLNSKFNKEKVIGTNDIGDTIERIMIEEGHYEIAKAYIIAREKQRQEARAGRGLGVKDDLGLSYNQLLVISKKYLRRDDEDNIIETPKEMFERVASALGRAENSKFKTQNSKQKDKIEKQEKKGRKYWEKKFFKVMSQFRFLPGGRTLANAGTVNNQLANCFVLPMEDSVDGVFQVVKESSILKKNGGGVGFSLGRIRPKGDRVATTTGRACGPVAIMHILNKASDMLLQAGGRRSGNMIVLPVSHPDIFEFLTCKEDGVSLKHINFSIGVTKKFMKAVISDRSWNLVNPRTGEIVNRVEARSIFDLATTMAWKNGDPGIIFLDEINKYNPTPQIGAIESVNLCGEQPLLSYEACNLGSINLAKHLARKSEILNSKSKKRRTSYSDTEFEVDWEKLRETVRIAVRALDNVVSICTYPLEKVEKTVKKNRKIGLGVMGWADMLTKMKIAYNSKEALKLAEDIGSFISKEGIKASQDLAEEKGAFENFSGSKLEKEGKKAQRNATITTIAPTGSIAMSAGCSYGIEPHFALAFYKQVIGGYKLPELNNDLMQQLQKFGLAGNGLVEEIMEAGSVQKIEEVPEKIKKIFVTAHDLKPKDHIRMQAAWQKNVDNAVSKTINLNHDATVEDVAEAFILAWKLKCKGVTVYRDTSRSEQVLNVGQIKKNSKLKTQNSKLIRKKIINREKKGEICPMCGGKLQIHEGCKSCPGCGFSACSV